MNKEKELFMKKWHWCMDYCKEKGITPGDNWAWKEAEEAYREEVKPK